MRIELKLVVRPDGFVGGKYETDPYLSMWASFGHYRQPIIVSLVNTTPNAGSISASVFAPEEGSVTPLDLNITDNHVRGDESVWFQMFARTSTSGVDEIDKEESSWRVRSNPACATPFRGEPHDGRRGIKWPAHLGR